MNYYKWSLQRNVRYLSTYNRNSLKLLAKTRKLNRYASFIKDPIFNGY